MESFLVCVWVGGARFSHTAMVRFDEVLCRIFEWKKVASVSTFTRFFRRFGRPEVDKVFGHIHGWFWHQLAPKTLTLDLDSSVVTRYGEKQEGAVVGYNPQKRGRCSHHPLFCFVADLRMVLHAWLRVGNTAASSGVERFLEEALAILGHRHRVGLVRADSGFFSGKFLDLLEFKKISYIVAVKLNSSIRFLLEGLSNWTAVGVGIWVGEMSYQAHGWKSKRRIIVVRERIDTCSRARGKLLFALDAYRYQIFVTDLTLPAAEAWRLYRGRADSENRIAELKADFGMSGFCLRDFFATEAAFRTVLLAYNLMSLFRQVILQTKQAPTLATMRFQCFALGASLGRQGHQKVLRIHLPPPKRSWFEGLWSKIQNFSDPWPIKT